MNRSAFLFALLTVLFTCLFAADVMGYFNIAHRPVARLRATDGNVRRLAKNQLTWDRAQGGTLFGFGDTIATGEDSRAKLVFFSGGDVDLESGAMLVLGGEKGELKLNFVAGTGRVRVSKTSQTKVSVVATNGGKTQPKAGVVEVADLPEELEEVAEAEDKPEGKHAAKATLPPPPKPVMASIIQEKSIRNPQKSLSAKGELVTLAALPPAPKLTFPERDSVVRLNGSTVARLQWAIPAPASDKDKKEIFTYEIVLRPLQSSGVEKILRSEKSSLAIDELAKGKYLWSVRAVSADGRRGPASEIRGIEIKIPEHISKPVILPVRVE
jgi:hypothetical protein